MKLTYIRWSMTIIETRDLTLVTDPVFHMFGIRQAPRSYDFERMPRPDLVGITAFTSQAGRAYEIAKEFRQRGICGHGWNSRYRLHGRSPRTCR